MHFQGFYTLARAAGGKPEVARIIAHASQFLEDALNKSTQLLWGAQYCSHVDEPSGDIFFEVRSLVCGL